MNTTSTPALRELLILRHTKSDHSDPSLIDFERPLSERGREDAHTMGRWLHHQNLIPDYILTSPAKRTLQTIRRAKSHFDPNSSIPCQHEASLYEASLEALLNALTQIPTDSHRVLIVGHNPSLEQLLTHLVPESNGLHEVKLFPTGALAHLILPANWQQLRAGCAKLINLWRVKSLPTLH
jgi:phosphohistidine phosphatase